MGEMSKTNMDRHRSYRIGLDIGIASVGWAVLENNSQDEPIRILDLGVRIFEAAEVPKTGAALAAERRDARTARRRIRRRRHRLERIKWLFEREGLIQIDSFMERYHSPNLPDVYELRYEGLERKLSNEEFAQVLLHIAKHRGFRSTRKAELKEGDNGKVLKATEENRERMEEHGYRTVGEMIYKDAYFHTECAWADNGYLLTPRNKADDYSHTMLRALLEEEVHILFDSQRKFGNEKATEKLEQEYLEIMLSQRSFDMGPGQQADGTPSPYAMEGFGNKVGYCTLERESGERRAAKATYTAELFVALQKITHMKLVHMDGTSRFFTEEERNILLEMLSSKKEIKYAAVRKKLNLPLEEKFNTLNYNMKRKGKDNEEEGMDEAAIIAATEKATFISMSNCYEYRKRIGDYLDTLPEEEQQDLLDEIGTILTCYKNDDSRMNRLTEAGLSKELADSLLELTPAKFQHLSIKAMKNIMPYMKEGMVYDLSLIHI